MFQLFHARHHPAGTYPCEMNELGCGHVDFVPIPSTRDYHDESQKAAMQTGAHALGSLVPLSLRTGGNNVPSVAHHVVQATTLSLTRQTIILLIITRTADPMQLEGQK